MPTTNPFAAITQSRDYRIVRRAFVRDFVGRKPTIREAQALDTAALYAERARLAATDPSMSPDMICKLNAAARTARDMLADIAEERRSRGIAFPALDSVRL